ncbi:MAG: AAA family ATPase [Anaerolineaceae bacterium]|nr:AAA family ATPase [Anaerolineaceae bacterium]
MDTKALDSNEIAYYSTVTQRSVEWLWYPYIPYGKITLLQGDPGDGKSTFMLHLVARITTKGKLPDGKAFPECQNVIYQCSEDSPADTIKPRLIAAGADCDRVAFISEENDELTIDDHRVEEAIVRTNARLCIFDPIQAYIPPDSDMQNAAKMRAVMKRLAGVAERTRCAIVLIGHMTKAASGKNLYRGLGSIDIAATARSVLMIERDPGDSSIRYMFPVKSSLAYEGCAIRFMFDRLIGFQFLGTSNYKSAPMSDMDDGSKAQRAERMMRAMLLDGEQVGSSIIEHIQETGISEHTIRLTARKIGVKSFRKGTKWYWKLEQFTQPQEVQYD